MSSSAPARRVSGVETGQVGATQDRQVGFTATIVRGEPHLQSGALAQLIRLSRLAALENALQIADGRGDLPGEVALTVLLPVQFIEHTQRYHQACKRDVFALGLEDLPPMRSPGCRQLLSILVSFDDCRAGLGR
jgi:hypothetical protein